MSQWRRVAVERLPELRDVIDGYNVVNPMSLWIELNLTFDELCAEEIPNIDLISRVWGYVLWCLSHRSGDVRTGVALGFCEHLIDSKARASILPKLMSKKDFMELKELLNYHNSSEKVEEYANRLWPKD